MSRIGRVIGVGYPHHITQRGNYRQECFADDSDRKQYLCLIREYSEKYKLKILAYCLMDNHVHFVAMPEREDSLSRVYNVAHMRYSQYYNKRIGGYGHLWQGRFYSCILDERHLRAAVRYVERNPVRAKLVESAQEWPWSSALTHSGQRNEKAMEMANLFSYMEGDFVEWAEYLREQDSAEQMEKIKRYTKTGMPLCGERDIKKLEQKLLRKLTVGPRGRPWPKKNK